MSGARRAGQIAMLAALLFIGKAFSLATHVIPDAELAKRVRLTRLADFVKSPDAHVRTADFEASRDEDSLLVARGRDRAGKLWELHLSAASHGLWVTAAERTRTYFFAGYTGGAGMAPPAWIVALSFDSQRRPVTFCVRGYENYGNTGIEELVNLDGTGPELIVREWVETDALPDARSGYYVTTLYQQRGIYWYRVDGRHGVKTYPLFERWIILPGRQPQEVPAPPESRGWLHNYGNDPSLGGSSWNCEF